MDATRPIHSFHTSFSLSISGGSCGADGVVGNCGAAGVSFVFGALPPGSVANLSVGDSPLGPAFGQEGTGSGLRVGFVTGDAPRVEVVYRNVLLSSVGADLRRPDESFVLVDVWHTPAEGLSVQYDGELLVSNLTLAPWEPQPDWQFGFGARTDSAVDTHAIGHVTIVADALVAAA